MHNQEMLEKCISYEKMVAEISEMAVRINNMDDFLKKALSRMGNVLQVSRVFIFYLDKKTHRFCCKCGWNNPNVEIHNTNTDITLFIPAVERELSSKCIINCPDVKNMIFQNYRNHLLVSNVKSTLNVPLFISGELYGFIGFDEHRFHREWHQNDLHILKTAAQIISRAIENNNYEKELINKNNLLESIFSSVEEAIITVDNSMKVIAVNKASWDIEHTEIKPGFFLDKKDKKCTQACLSVLRETLETNKTIRNVQICCFRQGEREQIVSVSCSPLMNDKGKGMGGVLVIRDITRLSHLETFLRDSQNYQGIIGQSEKMQKIYDLLRTLSDMSTTVLVTGESGTGKEKIASALHYGGCRAGKPFIRVNCSALAESLLENELFGHAKGAFTGADHEVMGRFEAAQGGTILLDEIGDISPLIQLKLLRVLENKEIERIGETKPRRVDVRVIAATNKDLKKAIAEGKFREDFYYRLNVMNIHIPPLRERVEDIPLLVDHFCRQFNVQYGKSIQGVSPEVMEIFMSYKWIGNIRELKHVIERAYVLCTGNIILPSQITLDPHMMQLPNTPSAPKGTTNNEKSHILAILKKTGWNISKSARLLGMSRWTLYRRMLAFDIKRPAD